MSLSTPTLVIGLAVFASAEPRWLTQATDLYPVLSPDGRTLLFHSSRLGAPRLFVADRDGRNLRVLNGVAGQITPDWSPDGTRIAFSGEVDGQLDIFVANADGSGARRVTNDPGADIHPHWMHDGQRIVFNAERAGAGDDARGMDVWSMSADGSDLRRHTSCDLDCTYASPSPDGRRLVYRREFARPAFDWDLSATQRDSEIVVADLDGGNERAIAPNAGFDGWPTWSPDGAWIAFTSNRSGPASVGQVYLVRPDGSDLRAVTRGPWSHAQPRFSPDGRSIFVYRLREGADYQFGFIAEVRVEP